MYVGVPTDPPPPPPSPVADRPTRRPPRFGSTKGGGATTRRNVTQGGAPPPPYNPQNDCTPPQGHTLAGGGPHEVECVVREVSRVVVVWGWGKVGVVGVEREAGLWRDVEGYANGGWVAGESGCLRVRGSVAGVCVGERHMMEEGTGQSGGGEWAPGALGRTVSCRGADDT